MNIINDVDMRDNRMKRGIVDFLEREKSLNRENHRFLFQRLIYSVYSIWSDLSIPLDTVHQTQSIHHTE